jgi:O-antigen ligase
VSPFLQRCGLAGVALLCALPFLQPYHRHPLTAFYSEWLAFVLGCAVALVLASAAAWREGRLPWSALAPLALALLLFLHGLLDRAPYFGQALTAALYLLWAALLVLAADALARLGGREALFDTLAAGLALGALASALAGLIQHLQWPTLLDAWIARTVGAAIFGNLAQANHFAAYTTLGLFAFAFLHYRGRVGAAGLALAAAPMLLVLGLSGSRAAALYLLAALLLAAAEWRRRRGDAARRLALACIAYAAAYVLLQALVAAGVLQGAPRDSVTAAERMVDGAASIADRLRLWQAAGLMFAADPLAGAGWGQFATGFFERAALFYPQGGYQLYHHAHNLVLQLLAETGLAGLACLVLPLACAWRRGPPRPALPAGCAWLAAALGATLLLHSLLEYPLWYAYFLAPAALLLGALPQAELALRLPRLWRVATLLLLAGGLVNLGRLWPEYRDFERLFQAVPPPAVEQAAILARLHRNPLLRHYVEVAYTLPMRPRLDELDHQLYANTRALRFVPADTLAWRQALLLALADRPQEALVRLRLARAAYPQPPQDYLEALHRLAAAQPERLRPLLESATETSPTARP